MKETRAWLIAALIGVVAVFAYVGAHMIGATGNAAVPGSLQVLSEQLDGRLILNWNGSDALLVDAANVDLFIEDGAHRVQLLLLPEQVAAGRIEYSPFTNNVSFRLVAHARSGRTAQESIRVIGRDVEGTADRSTVSLDPGTLTIRDVSH